LARETCVASLDAGSPVCLQVTKQGNGQTYAETLAYLEMLRPHEILLNEGRRNSPLARKVLQLYSGNENLQTTGDSSVAPSTSTVVKFIPRSSFDQTKGAEMLRRLARKETYDAALLEEYILLSSAHAVLHYTQRTLGSSFSRNCLDINVNSGGKNRMAIDRSSLLQLELLTNAKTGNSRNTLIQTIDCTKTTVGSRLLRTNLIAPPSRIDTINARLDLVDTFLNDENFFYSVLEHLQNLPAVDKMLTNVAIVPRKPNTTGDKKPTMNVRLASKGISALVYIKSTLTAMPVLTQVLKDHLEELDSRDRDANNDDGVSEITGRSSLLIGLGGGEVSTVPPRRHHLLRAIIFAVSQPELAEVCDTISEIFTDSTSFSRNANAMRHQECFALKSADDGMMDVLRKAFLANVDDIYKNADEYAEVHGFHVAVRYTTTRGYYLSIPSDVASRLPDVFIQTILRGNHIHCTTEEVHSLNIRSQDNVNDLLLMTRDRIQEVLDVARENYDALASLSDAVALLDLCHSFADKVTLCQLPWSRPVLHDNVSPTATEAPDSSDTGITIRNGRFGIDVTDSYVSEDGPPGIVPNDTYATGMKNFTVVSGINGSGKSTYLKQIAIIVLLAHCGSYVPAEYASIPVRFHYVVHAYLFPSLTLSISLYLSLRFVLDFVQEWEQLMIKVNHLSRWTLGMMKYG
jgi:DNA mismatch repair protein MSH4